MKQILKSFLIATTALLLFSSITAAASPDFNGVFFNVNSDSILKEAAGQSSFPVVKKKKKYDRMDLAWKQEKERTKDISTGEVPVERLIPAYAEAKKRLANMPANRSPIPGVNWVERGPSNVAGRTRALMFDPTDNTNKKVWAGSVGGGIWYNNDITSGTVNWTKVNDFLSSIAITCITYDPTNTQVFYMGSGEGFGNLDAQRGVGIFKSTDAGATWSVLSATSSYDFINDIVVTSTGVVIAATESGVIRSTTSGSSWTSVVSGNATDLELASDGAIYAGINANTVKKSIDGGATWTTLSTGGAGGSRVELAVAPSDANVVYAMAGDGSNIRWFKKTTDGGSNWTDVTIPIYLEQSCSPGTQHFTRDQSWYDLIMSVSPTNPSIVMVGGVDIHRSINGGTSWTSISYWTGGCKSYVHADQHAMAFRPGFPDEAIFGCDGGVFYSVNAGNSSATPVFQERNTNYNVTQFYACATKNDVAGVHYFLAGAQDNGTNRLNVSGIGSSLEVTGGDGCYCFIDQDNPNIQISSYVNNTFYLLDGNGSQTATILNDAATGSFVNVAEYNSVDNVLYTYKDASTIYRISGIGGTRTVDNVALGSVGGITAMKTSPYNSNVLFIGAGGKVFKVDGVNTSTSPTVTQVGSTSFNSISSIDVGANDNQLLITISNYGAISIYETKDGSTWLTKEGNLPDMPVRWGLYNPENRNQVMLATELGVWSTDNLSVVSPEWNPTNSGLANVRCDMLKYRTVDKVVVVATHGRGVFTTEAFSNPIAAFTASQRIGYPGLNVQFADGSIAANSSWLWNFGDGTTSTQQNPSHIYSNPGTYTVSLTINNGSMTEIKVDYVKILPNVSTMSYLTTDGGNFEVNLDHFASEDITGSIFELGNSAVTGKDGTTSGSNAWVLGLSNANYANSGEARIYTPNFTFSQTIGGYQLEFKTKYKFDNQYDGFFLEYSTDLGATWAKLGNSIATGWYNTSAANGGAFSSGTPIFSGTVANYETKYYNVSFLAGQANIAFRFVFKSSNAVSDIGMAIDDFRILYAVPGFTVTPSSICLNETVTFTDNSTGTVDNYSWNFGPGASPATANTKGPHTVTYTTSGTKDILLSINNGSATKTNFAMVTVKPLPENRTLSITPFTICKGESSNLNISNSRTTTSYQLRNEADNSNIGTPKMGTGATLSFDLGAVQSTTTYNVLATLNGCILQLTSKPTLTVNSLPLDQDLSAVKSSFCGVPSDSTDIVLASSEAGTSYQLREDVSGAYIKGPVNGTGGSISLPTGYIGSTTTYNVFATRTGCTMEMTEKVTIAVGNTPDNNKYVYAYEPSICEYASTSIVLEFSDPGISYQLRNNADNSLIGAQLTGNGGDISFSTGTLNTNTTFNILADQSGCQAEMLIEPTVAITPGPLNKPLTAEVSNFCGQTTASTNIVLIGSQSGVTYRLYNIDDIPVGNFFNGNGTNRNFPTGPLTSTTSFYMTAYNPSTGCSRTLEDFPVVVVGSYAADKTVITTSEKICDGSSTIITVENPEVGVIYKLRNDADNSIIAEMLSTANDPDNVSATTGVLNSTTTYNVFTDKYGECFSTLTTKPTVSVVLMPEERTATLDKSFVCGSGSGIVTITNAQLGVSYSLKDAADIMIGSADGTDADITLSTGSVNTSTSYTVTAIREATCTKVLSSPLDLEVRTLPLEKELSISPSTFCTEGSPVITVKAAEDGVLYSLRNNVNNALIGNSLTGTGIDLAFPAENVNVNSVYNVLAEKNGCALQMTDKPAVTINAEPANKQVTLSSLSICSGGSSTILINESQANVKYILYDSLNHVRIDTVMGNGEKVGVSTGILTERKAFEIIAYLNNCSRTLDTKPVVNVTAPVTEVTATAMETSICGPGSTDIVINSSQNGVSYQLRNDLGNIPIGAPVIGNGNNILLPTGSLDTTTTFNIMASRSECSLQMPTKPSIEIKSIPEVSITNELSILKATEGADSYQWLLNDVLIPGATESEYTPLENGSYKVIGTKNGCSATSEEFVYVKDGISKINGSKLSLSIFPNPAKDIVTLRHSSSWRGTIQLRIYNSVGALVKSEALPEKNSERISYKVDVSDLVEGQYYVEIAHTNGVITGKVTKVSK